MFEFITSFFRCDSRAKHSRCIKRLRSIYHLIRTWTASRYINYGRRVYAVDKSLELIKWVFWSINWENAWRSCEFHDVATLGIEKRTKLMLLNRRKENNLQKLSHFSVGWVKLAEDRGILRFQAWNKSSFNQISLQMLSSYSLTLEQRGLSLQKSGNSTSITIMQRVHQSSN